MDGAPASVGGHSTVFTTTSLCMFTAGPYGASWGGDISMAVCLAPPSHGSTKERIWSVRVRTGSHRPPLPAGPFSEDVTQRPRWWDERGNVHPLRIMVPVGEMS